MAKKPKIAAAKAHTAEPVKNLAAKPKTTSKAKAPRAKAVASKRTHNSHSDVAERMMQLAQLLAQDPDEAKVFAKKTGVYTNSGELTAAYR
jgi:hypothetical protein